MFKFSCALILFILPAILAGTIEEPSQEILDYDENTIDIAPAALDCNLNYACYNGYHYYFETQTKRTRDDAAKFCRSINMNLLSVEDCSENTFVANEIKNNDCYKKTFWTSGQRDDNDTWSWGTGAAVKYTNWMRAEPDFGKNQYCIAYHSGFVQWSDEVCSNKNYFICESKNSCK